MSTGSGGRDELDDALEEVGYLGSFAARIVVLAEHAEGLDEAQLRRELYRIVGDIADRPAVARWVPEHRRPWGGAR